jgi:hypothetical protein
MEAESFPKSSQRAPTGLIERLPLTNYVFKPFRQQTAHGASFLGRQDSRLAQQVSVELQSDIRLHNENSSGARMYVQHHCTCCSGAPSRAGEQRLSVAPFEPFANLHTSRTDTTCKVANPVYLQDRV